MKILTAGQIRGLDAFTIEKEPIASIDLMERASLTFVQWFMRQYPDTSRPVVVFCGIGNNGGDGLAAARLLNQRFYEVTVFTCAISTKTTPDFETNLKRLSAGQGVRSLPLEKDAPFPALPEQAILIDAIFGSGLNRPLEGYWAALVNHLNALPNERVAIDVPSGLLTDQPTTGTVFRARFTFSFELPKLAFLFPENHEAVGEWRVESIGLNRTFIEQAPTPYFYSDASMVRPLLHTRSKFGHKGSYGHALLIMGSRGSVGAAVLAARACLRSGPGLVTVHAPACACDILQTTVPEAMVSVDRHEYQLSEIPDLTRYAAIGVGCGLGRHSSAAQALLDLVRRPDHPPLVIDADAINMLATQSQPLSLIPPGSILTPHPKEFERLFGKTADSFEQNELQRRQARELGIYIVLKRAFTAIACPDGSCYFNATGNPGMATGGSGDVLTGIITGLLAQGYTQRDACLTGVYLHGLAGDLAAAELGQEALIAGDITGFLGKAFCLLSPPLQFPTDTKQ